MFERVKALIDTSMRSGLHRKRKVYPTDASHLVFSSNDYLSLGQDTRLKAAWQESAMHYAVGSGGSPLITGYHEAHRQFETHFSRALGVDDCLYFSSGYAANISLTAFLSHLEVPFYIDKASHASIYDGIKYAGAYATRYQHCNPADLKKKLQNKGKGAVFTESVFSMNGSISPLLEIMNTAKQHGSEVFVDEAHAFGLMGERGLGLVHALHLSQKEVPLRVIPLGKAFAGGGAIIAGQGEWIDALLQSSRPYIYSTAPSPAMVYAYLKNLEMIQQADDRRRKLFELIRYFRQSIQNTSHTWRDSHTAIQQLQLGCPHKAQSVANRLLEQQILCVPMRQPTVSKKETGLRVILNYHHQTEDIDKLLFCLQRIE